VALRLLVLAALAWALAAPAARAGVPVRFGAPEARLAGEVLLPPGRGPHPGLILLHGSGPATREPYRAEARWYAGHGFAALIFDKRGTGASGGSAD
jgi:predicted acyl esterase